MSLVMLDPLTVPGTLDSLSAIARYVLAAAQAAGLDSRAAYRLRLAVDEIATNVISHGYEEAGHEGSVVVKAEVDEQTLRITLEDTAPPFDPFRAPMADQTELAMEDRPIGGLGVFLAMRGVDEFRYEHDGTCNRNIFVMRSPAK
jgi:serine/threonine-protein kinase RsbW